MKKTGFTFVLVTIILVTLASCAPGTFGQINTPSANNQTGTPAPNGQINVPALSIPIYWPGPNPLVNTADPQGGIAGILLGIWHGIISPVTLVVSFVNPDVQMYEVHNNGNQYNLGFLLGIIIFFGVLGAIFGSRRR